MTSQTKEPLLRFLQRHLDSLDTIFVPTYYDGDKNNLIWGSKPHLSEPWDFFHRKTPAQRENIRYHNLAAKGDSNAHPGEFDAETRIPVLVETTGSPILMVKLRMALDSDIVPGKEVEIFMNSDTSAMFCRVLTNEVKGRKVVPFTVDNSKSAEVPLGPIFDGFNGPNTTLDALEEFRVTYTEVQEYADDMLAEDEQIVPKDFVVKSLKLMKLHN
jgi:hypothetical protein